VRWSVPPLWASALIRRYVFRKRLWSSNGSEDVRRCDFFFSNAGSDPTDYNPDAVSPELRRLGVGRVMDDVSQKMQRRALKNEDQLKILVNCTHDTTIAGVLQTFGVYDQKWALTVTAFRMFGSQDPIRWPTFTAHMSFELYKDKSDASPPQGGSFLNKFTSSFIGPKIPKTYCTYEICPSFMPV